MATRPIRFVLVTPEEREAAMRRYGYRSRVQSNELAEWGYMLAIPVSMVAVGAATIGHRPVVGVALLLVGAVVSSWAVSYLRKPVRPDDDADFDREIRYRIADEERD